MHCVVVVMASTTKLNCLTKRFTDITGASFPSTALVRDIIFHACVGIDFEFATVNWTAETGVILSCVDVVGIVFRVIDVFFRTVDSETFFRDLLLAKGGKGMDLEFSGRISEGHETEDPNKDTNRSGIQSLGKRPNINRLRIIASTHRHLPRQGVPYSQFPK